MKRAIAIFALLLTPVPAQAASDGFHDATPAELQMKEVPYAPGAPAVVLDWNVRHDDESSIASEYVRIKVLTEAGKSYGDVKLLTVPATFTVRDVRARTTRPDGTIVPFDGKIYDRVVVKHRDVRLIEKTFTLPSVEVGSILEYRYSVTWPYTQARTNRWALQREIPIRNATFFIRPAPSIHSICTTRGLPPSKAPTKNGNHYDFSMIDVPPFVAEPFSGPDEVLKPQLEFFYTEGDTPAYWKTFGETVARYTEDFIGKPSALATEVIGIVGDASAEEAKLRRIYDFVQKERNLSWEPDKTEQEAKREKLRDRKHAQDVIDYGYGTRAELNALFVALARAAGFEAETVLVYDRDDTYLSRQLPEGDKFSGTIAVVKLGGIDRFFDPGTPHARFGLLRWQNTALTGMRLNKKQGGTWVTTPDHPHLGTTIARAADLHLEDGVVKGTATITMMGQEALVYRLLGHGEDETTQRKRIEEAVKKLLPAASTVKLASVTGLGGTDEPLIVKLDLELPDLASTTGSRALVPLAIFEGSALHQRAAQGARDVPVSVPGRRPYRPPSAAGLSRREPAEAGRSRRRRAHLQRRLEAGRQRGHAHAPLRPEDLVHPGRAVRAAAHVLRRDGEQRPRAAGAQEGVRSRAGSANASRLLHRIHDRNSLCPPGGNDLPRVPEKSRRRRDHARAVAGGVGGRDHERPRRRGRGHRQHLRLHRCGQAGVDRHDPRDCREKRARRRAADRHRLHGAEVPHRPAAVDSGDRRLRRTRSSREDHRGRDRHRR
jgi:hypothetical protein